MAELRAIGSTDLRTPPLVLGGNVFGWTVDQATGHDILDRFVDAGGTMIDTADVYSAWIDGHEGGESERAIGGWLKRSGRRQDVLIATKVGMLPGEGGEKLAPARIAAACDASLRRLGVETIDLYYAHQDDDDVPQEDVLGAFQRLIDAGKVRHIAASNFGAMRLKSALELSAASDLPHFRALQPEYNLVSRHKFEGELQDQCVTHNIGVLPYFGLAAGYLTGKYRSDDDVAQGSRSDAVRRFAEGSGPQVLTALDAVVDETGATHAQVALAWLAAQPGVTAPIASATSVKQLNELIGSWDVKLSDEQLRRLTDAGT